MCLMFWDHVACCKIWFCAVHGSYAHGFRWLVACNFQCSHFGMFGHVLPCKFVYAFKRVWYFVHVLGLNSSDETQSRWLGFICLQQRINLCAKVERIVFCVCLMAETNEDVEHKGSCDTELSTSEPRTKETTAVEMLHAAMDELGASICMLTEVNTWLT